MSILMSFMYLAFTCMSDESYGRRFGSLLLCDVTGALINSLCWFYTRALGLALFQDTAH